MKVYPACVSLSLLFTLPLHVCQFSALHLHMSHSFLTVSTARTCMHLCGVIAGLGHKLFGTLFLSMFSLTTPICHFLSFSEILQCMQTWQHRKCCLGAGLMIVHNIMFVLCSWNLHVWQLKPLTWIKWIHTYSDVYREQWKMCSTHGQSANMSRRRLDLSDVKQKKTVKYWRWMIKKKKKRSSKVSTFSVSSWGRLGCPAPTHRLYSKLELLTVCLAVLLYINSAYLLLV